MLSEVSWLPDADPLAEPIMRSKPSASSVDAPTGTTTSSHPTSSDMYFRCLPPPPDRWTVRTFGRVSTVDSNSCSLTSKFCYQLGATTSVTCGSFYRQTGDGKYRLCKWSDGHCRSKGEKTEGLPSCAAT